MMMMTTSATNSNVNFRDDDSDDVDGNVDWQNRAQCRATDWAAEQIFACGFSTSASQLKVLQKQLFQPIIWGYRVIFLLAPPLFSTKMIKRQGVNQRLFWMMDFIEQQLWLAPWHFWYWTAKPHYNQNRDVMVGSGSVLLIVLEGRAGFLPMHWWHGSWGGTDQQEVGGSHKGVEGKKVG